MDQSRILDLLRPFLPNSASGPLISKTHLGKISAYLDLLQRWNSRTNLTSVRDPEEIIPRHFGESIFAARHIFPESPGGNPHVVDIGAGAGFPGVPIKLWAEDVHLTLIESNHKKATFLREVIRTLQLDDAEVFAGRAETFQQKGDVVTLRAMDHFEEALPTALSLMKPNGRIMLLVGSGQEEIAHRIGLDLTWAETIVLPQSLNRVVMLGQRTVTDEQGA